MIQAYITTGVLSAMVAFAGAWTVQGWRMEAKLSAVEASHAQSLSEAQAQARAREHALMAAKQQVEKDHAVQKKQSQRAIAGVRSELDRLRDTLAARSTGTDPATSARVDGAACTERELLGEGASHLAGLATETERLALTLSGLQGYVRSVCQ